MVEERVQTFGVQEWHYNKLWEMHYYSRYIGENTELYCFGNGLGDQTCINQVGDCFLELMDEGEDPELGRIMMSFGGGSTSFKNFIGDHIVVWAWGVRPETLEGYLNRFQVRPELVLNPYSRIREQAEKLGYATLKFWSGVNPRMFKPLGLLRSGVGYSGRSKSAEQYHVIIEPVSGRPDFEWRNKYPNEKEYLTIEQYNRWLNSKQVILGMIEEDRHDTEFVPTRLFESLASGTPAIIYEVKGVEEHLGFKYPYLSNSASKTAMLVNFIMDNWTVVHPKVLEWSRQVREKHSYKVRLKELFRKLKNE